MAVDLGIKFPGEKYAALSSWTAHEATASYELFYALLLVGTFETIGFSQIYGMVEGSLKRNAGDFVRATHAAPKLSPLPHLQRRPRSACELRIALTRAALPPLSMSGLRPPEAGDARERGEVQAAGADPRPPGHARLLCRRHAERARQARLPLLLNLLACRTWDRCAVRSLVFLARERRSCVSATPPWVEGRP